MADGNPLTQVVGRIVVRADDDSPCPVTGRIIAQVDGDSVTVAWGDEQYRDVPSTSLQWFDELRPAGHSTGLTP